jgi:CheY-like chemotaxis protein
MMLDNSPRTGLHVVAELTAKQLKAIDAFNEARLTAERIAAQTARSREMRMDVARRLEVLRREHEAVIERAEGAIRSSGEALSWTRPATAIVAHRQPWFTGKVEALLERRGVHVLGDTTVGADAVGWAVAEQPDLVIVDDTLAMITGEECVREIREFCHDTVIAAHVSRSDQVAAMLEAGANSAHLHVVPVDRLVDDVMRLVSG